MPFVSTKVIALELDVAEKSVSDLIKRHGLPFHKVGSHNKFDLDEVRAWTKARAEQSRERRRVASGISARMKTLPHDASTDDRSSIG